MKTHPNFRIRHGGLSAALAAGLFLGAAAAPAAEPPATTPPATAPAGATSTGATTPGATPESGQPSGGGDLPRVSSRAVCLVLFQGECTIDPALAQVYAVSPNPMPPEPAPPPPQAPAAPAAGQPGPPDSGSADPARQTAAAPPPPPAAEPAEPAEPPEKAMLIEAIRKAGLEGKLVLDASPNGEGLVLTRTKPPAAKK